MADVYTSKVSSKGQIVIPVELRRKLGIEEGAKVVVTEQDRSVKIELLDDRFFERFAGILSAGVRDALLEERRSDREREEQGR